MSFMSNDNVLMLNALWQPINYETVEDAITKLVAGDVVKALDIQYVQTESGLLNLTETPKLNPVAWEEWLTLPVRNWVPWEKAIHSTKLTIRAPTILIAINYKSMPLKEWKGKPSKEAIYVRDNGRCIYTNRKVERKDCSVDHIIPKSRGGSDDWTNLGLTTKELNVMKGNRLNSEVGFKLLKQPIKPKPIPVSHLIKEIRNPDWALFISK